jgi:hypothetical protein
VILPPAPTVHLGAVMACLFPWRQPHCFYGTCIADEATPRRKAIIDRPVTNYYTS